MDKLEVMVKAIIAEIEKNAKELPKVDQDLLELESNVTYAA